MGPGIIRHLQIRWSIARIAGIWHPIKYFDDNARPGIAGYCDGKGIGLLWPMDEPTLTATARHEAYHLSLMVLEQSGRWSDTAALRDEALAMEADNPALATVLDQYREQGWSMTDEPLVLLAECLSDTGDLEGLGVSPRLDALVRAIVRPKPLRPVLRAAAHVLAVPAFLAASLLIG